MDFTLVYSHFGLSFGCSLLLFTDLSINVLFFKSISEISVFSKFLVFTDIRVLSYIILSPVVDSHVLRNLKSIAYVPYCQLLDALVV